MTYIMGLGELNLRSEEKPPPQQPPPKPAPPTPGPPDWIEKGYPPKK